MNRTGQGDGLELAARRPRVGACAPGDCDSAEVRARDAVLVVTH